MSEQKLAEDHVDWLLSVIRPLMVTEFLHGYKHGFEDAVENEKGNGKPHYREPRYDEVFYEGVDALNKM